MSAFVLCIRTLRQSSARLPASVSLRQVHTYKPEPSRKASTTPVNGKVQERAQSTSATPLKSITDAINTTISSSISLEPYFVQRTPTRNLPIYQLAKAGGNLKLTKLRKLVGDTEALRKELEGFLAPKPEYVRINSLTGHIIIKV